MVRPARRTALAVSAVALSATSTSTTEAFQPQRPPAVSLPQHRTVQRRRGSQYEFASPLAVSATSSPDGSSNNSNNSNSNSNNSGSADATLQSLNHLALNTAESALSTLTNAADQVSDAFDEGYVDAYEVEQRERTKRRQAAAQEAARRRNQYEITVPLTGAVPSSSSSAIAAATATATNTVVGLTLRQIDSGGRISAAAFDFDSTSLVPNLRADEEMDPTARDCGIEDDNYYLYGGPIEVWGAVLQQQQQQEEEEGVGGGSQVGRNGSGGGGKGGVIVSSVVRGGAAWEAGVRPGDLILATSATVGQVRIVS